MDQVILGKTGLQVSVMGIGGGGQSRLGTRTGINSEEDAIALIRHGINAGVNFIDTAEAYGTEGIIGKAIQGVDRASLVISTKVKPSRLSSQELMLKIEKSLMRLGVDYIDIFSLQGVLPEEYSHVIDEVIPVLIKAREQGKIRFTGVSESGHSDPQHRMLAMAVQDECWDTLMLGFNILNQTGRTQVLAAAIERNLGIVNMYAVRSALSNTEYLIKVIQELIEKKEIEADEFDIKKPLDFLLHKEGATNIVDVAYRFCRYEPGIHVVLSGTGKVKHLDENIKSFSLPPLQEEDVDKLKYIFRNVYSILGN